MKLKFRHGYMIFNFSPLSTCRKACRTDCGDIYQLGVKLLGADKNTVVIDKCHLERVEEHPSGKWHKVFHLVFHS